MKSTAKKFSARLVEAWLHEPEGAPRAALALFHGAGGNAEAPLMQAAADAFCAAGFLVLRGNLPFRQGGAKGGPHNGGRDREGIRRAAEELKTRVPGAALCLAGHSYGGRQCTMLAAEDPDVCGALLLLSYPLHAPGRPEKPRTEHFPSLRTPALFVQGTRDTFGSVEELEAALKLIPARHKLIAIEGGRHGLPPAIAASLPGWLLAIMDF